MPSFDEARLAQALRVVARGVETGAYAGAVAAVGGANSTDCLEAFGSAALEPAAVPMAVDSLFDLASLTKVVATTPALLMLLEEGAFALETPVAHVLPAFGDKRVTMRHLLTHTSGLPAWRPLYLDHTGWAEYTAAICATPLVRDPGTQVEYTDLGFILLGAVIQAITGQSLPDFCREAVFRPLGMAQTGWLPQVPLERTVATERGNQIEYGMCKERAAAFPRWRQGILHGEVNDGNCWYGLGGVSSHAGLFGTAEDLVRYAQAWLRQDGSLLGRHTINIATRSHTPGMVENRGLGWKKPPLAPFPSGRATCGDMLSTSAFGHTGFTGTSLWIDPEKDLFVILLTNRLHPVPKRDSVADLDAVRPAFHNAVVASLR